MEPVAVKRRGRKRKMKDEGDVDKTVKKKQVIGKRSMVFIGRYVKKVFDGIGEFLGKIVSYDTGLYRVVYEDGDFEDLETHEVKGLLVDEMDAAFKKRKRYLDQYILKKHAKDEALLSNSADNKIENVETNDGVRLVNAGNVGNAGDVDKVESSVLGGEIEPSGAQDEAGSESSGDLSDYEQSAVVVEVERPLVPPPQLPSSSGNFGIPEEDVPVLLSVYSFLRSFSVCLFLSPFGLDEFVGALNSSVHNTLLDAIHVALIRALKSHVEILSSEGSELASKCLRSMDWSLLDSLTWPVFIVQYLTTMRYTEGPEWKEFYVNVWEKDYYTLSAARKLAILQLLCDGASNSEEIRTEIDNREASEFGLDPDGVTTSVDEKTPRRGHPLKYSLSKDQEPKKNDSFVSKAASGDGEDEGDDDGNGDECRLCGMDGTLICCDGCPSAYHSRCLGLTKTLIPAGEWYCPECTINRIGPVVTKATSLRGAEIFGVDPYEHVFLGSCDHLLVMKASTSSGPHIHYYSPVDIPKVLQALTCSVEHAVLYSEICKGILKYWKIPENVFSIPEGGTDTKTEVRTDTKTEIGTDNKNETADNINGVTENDLKSKDLGSGEVSLNEPVLENGSCNDKSHVNSVCEFTDLSSQKKEANLANIYMGSSFKPQAYQNVYIHGDFAASAGARLAILSSEEKMTTQTQTSSASHRKLVSANYSLQAKAFSLAAKRFYWPNYEKKLVEISRERCGWCLSCKATGSSKRGCLLNAAASNAIKGAAKILSSLRQSKNVEGSLAAIATYVMFMEESLFGLIVGPFLNPSYRNQWQKHVEEAVTLGEIKVYLLEFERNVRDIAFSTDWIRLVDDSGSDSQLSQTAKSVAGSTKKRGPGRGRKPAIVTPEIPDTDVKDLSTDLAWWRGGMLSKHIFQKGILPQTMIKHAARQGGCEKINGVQYVDGLEVPKRSRQCIWRAAVDMSKTASQLALQVRYLDLHVRWNELVCPEQPFQDGKGIEAEATAFRNACIIDKKITGNKICYGIIFENQKHIPSRVLKKVLEVEETGDKKPKNWFLETQIPLYLIKEYETAEAAGVHEPTSDILHVSKLTRLSKKQLNASGKNIFSFLEQKRDNSGKCFCTACRQDVSFRIAARCSACQGYCHEGCAVGTDIQTAARVEFLILCKRCHIEKEHMPNTEIVGDSPTSPLLLQGQDSQHSTSVIKPGKPNGYEKPLECSHPASVQSQKGKSGKKNSKKTRLLQSVDRKPKNNSSIKGGSKTKSSSKSSKLCLGLVWKKKNPSDTGIEFRMNNILLKGNPNGHLLAPKCQLCAQPYNSDLMYLLCEKCKCWYHAESAELDESRVMELFGFKCCRCRRIRIPICPYTDPETRAKIEAKKEAIAKTHRQRNSELEADDDFDSDDETNDDLKDWELDATPVFESEEAVNVQEENEFGNENENENQFYSFPAVDQVKDEKLEADSGPKKLPVRRHIKPDKESDARFEIPVYTGINNPDPLAGESSTPIVEWDVPANGVLGDDMMFDYGDLNYEDLEFEPQTYFSFNELLADEGNSQPNKDGDPQAPAPPPAPAPAPDDCNPDQFQMGITYDEQEPMFSVESGLDMVPCRACAQTDPCPDLFCQTCGLWLHQACSPWYEDSSWEPETGWKCGHCREWC